MPLCSAVRLCLTVKQTEDLMRLRLRFFAAQPPKKSSATNGKAEPYRTGRTAEPQPTRSGDNQPSLTPILHGRTLANLTKSLGHSIPTELFAYQGSRSLSQTQRERLIV